MSPRLASLLSLLVFGLTGLLGGLADYAVDGGALAFVSVLGGGVIVAVVAYNAVRPDSYQGPEEWGPLVYLTVVGSVGFLVGTIWQYV